MLPAEPRCPAPRRVIDLQQAAIAAARAIPLVTRDPDAFEGLAGVVEVRAV